ncbi:MAG: hypothetical protein AMXMBFR34_44350 [Myxococcaceae bacterium]
MRRLPVAFALLVLWGAGASCGVDLHDLPGRACDDAHPCGAGRTCVDSHCHAPDELDGGDAGSPDAGRFDAGLKPLWQQRLHGFTNSTVDTACTLDIDPSRGNRVWATIVSADDASDTATAEVEDPARLPGAAYGHLQGHLTLPAPLQLRGPASFLALDAANGDTWLKLGFDAQGRLWVRSDAQTLSSSAMTEVFTRDGGFGAGDYVLDVSWTRGGARQVSLDGVLLASSPIGPGGTTTPPARLRLGVVDYGGDAGTGWTVTLSGWQVADNPAVMLEFP